MDRVRHAENIERRRCVARRCQEDEEQGEPLTGLERQTLIAVLVRDLLGATSVGGYGSV